MAGFGHRTIKAEAWLAEYRGGATEAEWPALRQIARDQFRADLRDKKATDEVRAFAQACLDALSRS